MVLVISSLILDLSLASAIVVMSLLEAGDGSFHLRVIPPINESRVAHQPAEQQEKLLTVDNRHGRKWTDMDGDGRIAMTVNHAI